tara:strand:- start:2291 stop:3961 length:1671 start_codon:yes stop_codon:yes gene_type:complete
MSGIGYFRDKIEGNATLVNIETIPLPPSSELNPDVRTAFISYCDDYLKLLLNGADWAIDTKKTSSIEKLLRKCTEAASKATVLSVFKDNIFSEVRPTSEKYQIEDSLVDTFSDDVITRLVRLEIGTLESLKLKSLENMSLIEIRLKLDEQLTNLLPLIKSSKLTSFRNSLIDLIKRVQDLLFLVEIIPVHNDFREVFKKIITLIDKQKEMKMIFGFISTKHLLEYHRASTVYRAAIVSTEGVVSDIINYFDSSTKNKSLNVVFSSVEVEDLGRCWDPVKVRLDLGIKLINRTNKSSIVITDATVKHYVDDEQNPSLSVFKYTHATTVKPIAIPSLEESITTTLDTIFEHHKKMNRMIEMRKAKEAVEPFRLTSRSVPIKKSQLHDFFLIRSNNLQKNKISLLSQLKRDSFVKLNLGIYFTPSQLWMLLFQDNINTFLDKIQSLLLIINKNILSPGKHTLYTYFNLAKSLPNSGDMVSFSEHMHITAPGLLDTTNSNVLKVSLDLAGKEIGNMLKYDPNVQEIIDQLNNPNIFIASQYQYAWEVTFAYSIYRPQRTL